LEGLKNENVVGAMIMCGEILDDFLEQKIQSDKVIEGVLKDINNSIESGLEDLTKS